ncbi:MAG TPA: amidohydrolase family protein [Xanthobacteraceae bacterium]|nr:amidohydrolase family protein [Xanthobacteraceae bacterium]
MDLILRNARLASDTTRLTDIGVAGGKIVALAPNLAAEAETLDAGGRLVSPGFVETHLHLDKACILDRCAAEGDLGAAIREVTRLKAAFTAQDVYDRARRTLERCILNGTTHVRAHLEVDPGIGLRGLDGVLPLVREYAWAVDLEICIFPQEGMLNNPGTEALMVAALRRGGNLIGACPYTDTDPHGQIDRIFALAQEFDVDIDMHLDFDLDPDKMDLTYVCRRTEELRYGGRVAAGHVTKLSVLDADAFAAAASRLRSAGVALTVLPSTDLFLMGRSGANKGARGVTPAHRLLTHGVNCSLATNNMLNPFTPFGDGSLIRMANLYANVCRAASAAEVAECFAMITTRAAALMNRRRYGIAVGNDADLVVLDCESTQAAVRELAPVLHAFKRGRRTVTRPPAVLHRPG